MLSRTQPLDFDKVKALYAGRIGQFPRFVQRVVERGVPIARPYWQDMPDFDVAQHLHHVALPAPLDQQALAAMLADIVSTPLDSLQPLWQVHVIDGVGSGSALVTRFHHCIGDGTAMTALSQQLFDATRHAPALPPEPRAAAPGDARTRRSGRLASAYDAPGSSARSLLATASATIGTVRHPQALIDKAALIAGGGGAWCRPNCSSATTPRRRSRAASHCARASPGPSRWRSTTSRPSVPWLARRSTTCWWRA